MGLSNADLFRLASDMADRIEALTEQLEDAFARGFCAGQRALKDVGKLVIIDDPKMLNRIEALTTQLAEHADVRKQIDHRLEELVGQVDALTAERDRQYDENVHRIFMQAKAETERDALQADNARLREALTVDPWGLGWRKWQAHAATVLNLSPGKDTK
jgi:hypothetical protein